MSHATAARWRELIKQLRARREELGLTQYATAHAFDVRPSSLHLWETGANVPNLRVAIAWADALGLDVALVERKDA